MSEQAFDLGSSYAFIEDGGAGHVFSSTGFWEELMSGQFRSDASRLVAKGGGWLVVRYTLDGDTPHWERHPAGEELLVQVSGAIDVVLDEPLGERTIELPSGRAFMVPRNTWHRQTVGSPGETVAITFGRGTEHRPV